MLCKKYLIEGAGENRGRNFSIAMRTRYSKERFDSICCDKIDIYGINKNVVIVFDTKTPFAGIIGFRKRKISNTKSGLEEKTGFKLI